MKFTRYDMTFLKPDGEKLYLNGLTVSEIQTQINKLLKEYYLYDANCSIAVINSLYTRPAKVGAFIRTHISLTNKTTKTINSLETSTSNTSNTSNITNTVQNIQQTQDDNVRTQ